jgi:charged multivesicular body protein 1
LKFAAKELERSAKKCEKDDKIEKGKLKKVNLELEEEGLIFYSFLFFLQAIQQGNMEGAKIYAENSIRNKNQALNFRRMASRVDAVAQRVQTAVSTKRVTQSMAGVVKSMEAAMNSMNLEQVWPFVFWNF